MTVRERPKTVAVLYGPGSVAARDLWEVRKAGRWAFAFVVPSADAANGPDARLLEISGPVLPRRPLRAMAAELRGLGVAGVTTFSDDHVVRAARLARVLGTPGPPPSAALIARSKFRQRVRLTESGVGLPVDTVRLRGSTSPDGEVAAVGFPVVLKPERGTGSREVRIVTSSEELRRLAGASSSEEPFVAEAFVPPGEHPGADWLGDYVSVESAVAGGEVHHFGVMDRLPLTPPFRESGDVVPSLLPDGSTERMCRLAGDAIEALGLDDCVVHTEIKLTRPEYTVIEVNARLGGFADRLFERVGGGRLLHAALDVATGDFDPPPPSRPSRAAMVYHVLAPLAAERVPAVPSARTLRSLPGVFRIDQLANVGDPVDWTLGALSRVAQVWICADDHDELRRRYERVHEAVAAAGLA